MARPPFRPLQQAQTLAVGFGSISVELRQFKVIIPLQLVRRRIFLQMFINFEKTSFTFLLEYLVEYIVFFF